MSKKTNLYPLPWHCWWLRELSVRGFLFVPGKITSPEELTTPAFLAQMAVSLHSLGPKQIVN